MAKRKKFYVVWKGRIPGVYDDWSDAEEQIVGFAGAQYKGYSTPQEAAEAYRKGTENEDIKDINRLFSHFKDELPPSYPPEVDKSAWAVDAGCSKNPGPMDYRGVDIATGKELFRVGPLDDGTNNIGEFLAIVHALALMEKKGEWHTIYSDSQIAIKWVRGGLARTKVQRTGRNDYIFQLIARAETWLRQHTIKTRIEKWDTSRWGEIPADFGRKK